MTCVCNTIQAEAEALVTLLRDFPDARAWVTFSCKVSQLSWTMYNNFYVPRYMYMYVFAWCIYIVHVVRGCFSLQDDLHICHGELFSEAVSSVAESSQVTAVGVNCTHPKHVEVWVDK